MTSRSASRTCTAEFTEEPIGRNRRGVGSSRSPSGRRRPIGIAALEDKIVQRALVEALNAVYEEDFLGFSYGFRPGRGQHDALDALWVGIDSTAVNWVLDADIAGFLESASILPPGLSDAVEEGGSALL